MVALIWIIAAAIIPRFSQAVIRAKHAKRVTDMRQIAWGVQVYQADHGGLVPATSMLTVDTAITWLNYYLVPGYITSMPLDLLYKPSSLLIWIYDYIQWWMPSWEQPAGFWQTPRVSRAVQSPGSYGFVPLAKDWKPNTSFALIWAFIEDTDYANWIIYPNWGTSRNIFIYYRGWTYVQILSWASQTLTTLVEANEIKDAICDRIDKTVTYNMPLSIVQPDWTITCYPANNNPLAVYWYSTRDNYYRYIYIQ